MHGANQPQPLEILYHLLKNTFSILATTLLIMVSGGHIFHISSSFAIESKSSSFTIKRVCVQQLCHQSPSLAALPSSVCVSSSFAIEFKSYSHAIERVCVQQLCHQVQIQ